MSLTDTQKQNVIFYLGWPGKTLIVGSTHYNNTVAVRLTNLNASIETQVASLLASILVMRTKYEASAARALVKKVGDIELNTEEHFSLSKEYKRQLKDLSNLLDIPIINGGSINIAVIN